MVAKKRNYKQEYVTQKARGEHKARMKRQTDRRDFDSADTGSVHRKSPKRAGKHISHNGSLARNVDNGLGYKLENPSKNMSRNYTHTKNKKGKG